MSRKIFRVKKWQHLFLLLLVFVSFEFIYSCYRQKSKRSTEKVETSYIDGNFEKALAIARPIAMKAKEKDRLLYLFEAGAILHVMKEYERSNKVFLLAEELSEILAKKRHMKARAFFLSDRELNYVGENFEHVLLRQYMAINYLMLSQESDDEAVKLENKKAALRYFKKVNFLLEEISEYDETYKLNNAARYLHAILAEELGNYNDSRVQYNNLARIEHLSTPAIVGRTHVENLASIAEMDIYAEEKKFKKAINATTNKQLINQRLNSTTISEKKSLANAKINFPGQPAVYGLNGTQLERVSIFSTKMYKEAGSIVFIHENGLAPVRVSRGKIKANPAIYELFKVAVATALLTGGKVGLSSSIIFSFIANSEEPVPAYKLRGELSTLFNPEIKVQQLSFEPSIFHNHAASALQNFEDNYEKLINKNIGSLAAKIVAAIVATEVVAANVAAKDSLSGFFLGLVGGVTAGSVIQSTLLPDLRSWKLCYNNLQIKRVFLLPGEYSFELDEGMNVYNKSSSKPLRYRSSIPQKIVVEPGKASYVVFRSF